MKLKAIVAGLLIIGITIVVYPSAKPVIDSFMATVTSLAPGADAFSVFLLTSVAFVALVAAFVKAILRMRSKE